METIGSYEAKTHLADLLDRVADGEQIMITRYGTPVARLIPAEDPEQQSVQEAIQELRSFREGRALEGATIQELIRKGRRF